MRWLRVEAIVEFALLSHGPWQRYGYIGFFSCRRAGGASLFFFRATSQAVSGGERRVRDPGETALGNGGRWASLWGLRAPQLFAAWLWGRLHQT